MFFAIFLTLAIALLTGRRPTKFITAMLFASSAYYLINGFFNLVTSFHAATNAANPAAMGDITLFSAIFLIFYVAAYILMALMSLYGMRTQPHPLSKLWFLPPLLILIYNVAIGIVTISTIFDLELLYSDIDPALQPIMKSIVLIASGVGVLIGCAFTFTPVFLLSKWLSGCSETVAEPTAIPTADSEAV